MANWARASLSPLLPKKEAALGVVKLLKRVKDKPTTFFGDFHSLELFYTFTVMLITKHFDSKVKPYEDLRVSQDFVEPCYRTKLELVSWSHVISHI